MVIILLRWIFNSALIKEPCPSGGAFVQGPVDIKCLCINL